MSTPTDHDRELDQPRAVIDLAAERRARTVDLSKDDAEEPTAPVDGVVLYSPGTADTAKLPRTALPRRPLVAAWLRDPASAKAAARWAVGYYAHCAAFHTLRLPLYWARLAARSPIGLARIVAATFAWVFDTEHRELRHSMVSRAQDPNAYLRLMEHRQAVVRGRAVLAGIALGVAALVAMAVASAPVATRMVAVAVVLGILGGYGRNAATRVTGRAVDTAQVPRLTADLIVAALGSLGLGELNRALTRDGAAAVRFPAPITRDGPGFRADIDLPPGVTAGDVIERRDRLASGLRRPLGCVWPEADQDVHSGRLVLWVGDKSLSASKPVAWPLAKTGAVNIFAPVTIGVDQRGRAVTITLIFAAALIGAVPRMGKTFLLRLILLAAGLDVRVEIHAYNLKGGADLDPLALIAHAYRTGDDPEDTDYLLRDLRALRADMRRRYRTLRVLPKEVCPESKVTDALAADRRLGLHPVLFAVDECQVMFEHPQHGREYEELVTDLVKRGLARDLKSLPSLAGHPAPRLQVHPHRDLRQRGAETVPEGAGPGRERHGARHFGVQERHPRHHVLPQGPRHRPPGRRGRGPGHRPRRLRRHPHRRNHRRPGPRCPPGQGPAHRPRRRPRRRPGHRHGVRAGPPSRRLARSRRRRPGRQGLVRRPRRPPRRHLPLHLRRMDRRTDHLSRPPPRPPPHPDQAHPCRPPGQQAWSRPRCPPRRPQRPRRL